VLTVLVEFSTTIAIIDPLGYRVYSSCCIMTAGIFASVAYNGAGCQMCTFIRSSWVALSGLTDFICRRFELACCKALTRRHQVVCIRVT